MEYLHVLSRPMVIDHDHDIIWTEAYMDTVVRTDDDRMPQKASCVNVDLTIELNRTAMKGFPLKDVLLKALQSRLLDESILWVQLVVHWVAMTSQNISGLILSLC